MKLSALLGFAVCVPSTMATIYCRDVSPPVSIIDALKRINIDLYSVTHEAGVKPTRQRGKDVNVSVPSTYVINELERYSRLVLIIYSVEVPQGITQMVACSKLNSKCRLTRHLDCY